VGFPDDAELGTRVELLLGGTWTDITPDTRLAQPITVTRGRADYTSQIQPSKVAVQIHNPTGTYSPRNATGLYYGKLGRNTPLRTSVAAGSPWLGLPPSGVDVRASTPSTTALNIAGDLDLRFDVQPEDWIVSSAVVELGGKWGAAGQQSWHLYLFSGFVTLGWSTDGTAETQAAVYLGSSALTPRMVVRATLTVNNGAGGHTMRVYGGPSMTGPWTQIGTDQITAGTAGTFASTAPVEFGDVSSLNVAHAPARLFAAQIRNGIDGTIVASPNFTVPAVGALSFTDSVGVPWTVNRATGLTNRLVRGSGEVPAFPPRWGTSGKLVTVSLEAAGITRRLGQGKGPLSSTLRRRIPSDPNLIAYWPMEEGQGATQAYSPLPGVRPMQTLGLTFAADSTLAGSDALPTLSALSGLRATVPSSPTGQWHVEFVYNIVTAPLADANSQLIIVNTSTASWRVGVGASGIHLDVTAPDGTSMYTAFIGTTGFFGVWTRFILKAKQVGSTISFAITWVNIGASGLGISDTFTGTVGYVTTLTASHGPALQGMPFGHIAVFNTFDTLIFDNADTGFNNEAAAVRAVRLAGEQGVPLRMPYGPTGTEAMGPQRPDKLLTLLQAAAEADEGAALFEPRDGVTFAWRPRYSQYNQVAVMVLDYAQRQVAPPLEPEDDDQASKNDVTVTRTGGSSGRATLDVGPMSTLDPVSGGIGRYEDSVTENLATDDQPALHAGWRLHQGTYDGMRFPAVTVNLAHCPELIDAAREVDIGDRIQILNPPPWLPPGTIDLIVQQITETLGIRKWVMTFACSPAGPWTVGVLDDPVLGRLDTDGSQLLAAATAADTVLRVQTTAGPRWTIAPADYPFDLTVGGEVVTATACSPDVVDAFGRTVSNSWGSADTGQAWAVSGNPSDFSVSSGAGRHLLSTVGASRWSTVPQGIPDWDVSVTVSTTALAVGASQFVAIGARFVDTQNTYLARLEFTTTATVALTIRKRVTGVETQLNGGTLGGLTHTAGGQFHLRFQGRATALRAKVWTGSVEPPTWHAVAVDTSFTAAGQVGMRSILNTGNTNTSPSAVYDDFSAALPQRMTVTRSTNGVIKAHSAGEAISLANPMILAL
jgi:hypothetical protein